MIRGAAISALVSLALFGAAFLVVLPGPPTSPLLDVPLPLAEHHEFTNAFVVPDTQIYGIAVWFKKSEAHLLDALSMSWTLSRDGTVVARGTKDALYVSSGNRVGSELWAGRSDPGAYSLQVEVTGGTELLRSASPRLIVQSNDESVGPPLDFVLSAGAKLAGALAAIVSALFLVAWGISKWQLVST